MNTRDELRKVQELRGDTPRACTADHLVMRSHGGITVPENIVAACRECNNSRHWSTFEQVREGTATLADVWPTKQE